jgi:hypothetical protein
VGRFVWLCHVENTGRFSGLVADIRKGCSNRRGYRSRGGLVFHRCRGISTEGNGGAATRRSEYPRSRAVREVVTTVLVCSTGVRIGALGTEAVGHRCRASVGIALGGLLDGTGVVTAETEARAEGGRATRGSQYLRSRAVREEVTTVLVCSIGVSIGALGTEAVGLLGRCVGVTLALVDGQASGHGAFNVVITAETEARAEGRAATRRGMKACGRTFTEEVVAVL